MSVCDAEWSAERHGDDSFEVVDGPEEASSHLSGDWIEVDLVGLSVESEVDCGAHGESDHVPYALAGCGAKMVHH